MNIKAIKYRPTSIYHTFARTEIEIANQLPNGAWVRWSHLD